MIKKLNRTMLLVRTFSVGSTSNKILLTTYIRFTDELPFVSVFPLCRYNVLFGAGNKGIENCGD